MPKVTYEYMCVRCGNTDIALGANIQPGETSHDRTGRFLFGGSWTMPKLNIAEQFYEDIKAAGRAINRIKHGDLCDDCVLSLGVWFKDE